MIFLPYETINKNKVERELRREGQLNIRYEKILNQTINLTTVLFGL